MDFFQHQDDARRLTARFILFFALSVVAIIVAVDLSTLSFVYVVRNIIDPMVRDIYPPLPEAIVPFWDWHVVIWSTFITIFLILIGTMDCLNRLSEGAKALAKLIGAREIPLHSSQADEQRLVNVVTEMSLASGFPIPALYVLDDEPGINSFAAGYRPSEAILTVTSGCLTELSRDELQAVVAHEFSHIGNGDIALNLRLMGVVEGLFYVGTIGKFFMSWLHHGDDDREYRGISRYRPGHLLEYAVFVFGFVLVLIGYVGVVFGRVLKRAVSRQREYLADASAVQFTRNPRSLVSALNKILHHQYGSYVESRFAEHLSHFFFAEGIHTIWDRLMATHPTIADRVRRVQPTFKFKNDQWEELAQKLVESGSGGLRRVPGAMGFADSPKKRLVESIGNPSAKHLEYAKELYAQTPKILLKLARQTSSAQSIVWALLLHKSEKVKQRQLDLLESTGVENIPQIRELDANIRELGSGFRLPLLDLSIAALKQLEPDKRAYFLEAANLLIEADGRLHLREFLYKFILEQQLVPKPPPGGMKSYHMTPIFSGSLMVLSLLAHAKTKDENLAGEYFKKGMARMTELPHSIVPRSRCLYRNLGEALKELGDLMPAQKKSFVDACTEIICATDQLRATELELLRAICEAMECPMPPIIEPTEAQQAA